MMLAAVAKDRLLGLCLNDIGPEIHRPGLERIFDYVGRNPSARTLAEIAETHNTSIPRTCLAWLKDRPGVTSLIGVVGGFLVMLPILLAGATGALMVLKPLGQAVLAPLSSAAEVDAIAQLVQDRAGLPAAPFYGNSSYCNC